MIPNSQNGTTRTFSTNFRATDYCWLKANPQEKEDAVVVKRSGRHITRTLGREFDGFNDPVVKVLLGVGIALTLTTYVVVLLKPLIGVAGFLVLLKSITWVLLAYAVVGAIFGFVRSIQYGRERRSRHV